MTRINAPDGLENRDYSVDVCIINHLSINCSFNVKKKAETSWSSMYEMCRHSDAKNVAQ